MLRERMTSQERAYLPPQPTWTQGARHSWYERPGTKEQKNSDPPRERRNKATTLEAFGDLMDSDNANLTILVDSLGVSKYINIAVFQVERERWLIVNEREVICGCPSDLCSGVYS